MFSTKTGISFDTRLIQLKSEFHDKKEPIKTVHTNPMRSNEADLPFHSIEDNHVPLDTMKEQNFNVANDERGLSISETERVSETSAKEDTSFTRSCVEWNNLMGPIIEDDKRVTSFSFGVCVDTVNRFDSKCNLDMRQHSVEVHGSDRRFIEGNDFVVATRGSAYLIESNVEKEIIKIVKANIISKKSVINDSAYFNAALNETGIVISHSFILDWPKEKFTHNSITFNISPCKSWLLLAIGNHNFHMFSAQDLTLLQTIEMKPTVPKSGHFTLIGAGFFCANEIDISYVATSTTLNSIDLAVDEEASKQDSRVEIKYFPYAFISVTSHSLKPTLESRGELHLYPSISTEKNTTDPAKSLVEPHFHIPIALPRGLTFTDTVTSPTQPLIFGLTKFGDVWALHTRRVKDDPGPFRRCGLQLIGANETYIETEDEFDTIIRNSDVISSAQTATDTNKIPLNDSEAMDAAVNSCAPLSSERSISGNMHDTVAPMVPDDENGSGQGLCAIDAPDNKIEERELFRIPRIQIQMRYTSADSTYASGESLFSGGRVIPGVDEWKASSLIGRPSDSVFENCISRQQQAQHVIYNNR